MRSGPPSSADRGAAAAWVALTGALVAGALLAPLVAGTGALDWRPALAWREPWRAWSAVFVHFSALHLAANVAGALLVAALGFVARVPWRIVLAWFAAWPLTQLGLLAQPELVDYGGLLSGVLFAGEFVCIFLGLRFTTASRMVVFIYLAPFVVALGMPFISRSERLRPAQLGGLALAFAGVASAFVEGFSRPAAGAMQWVGDGLGILAALLWGATTLAIRGSALSRVSAEKTLFYQLGVSTLFVLPAALLTEAPWPRRLSTLAWSSLAFQVVVVTFASYLLWFWLVRHYAATRLASFTMLTPIFGLALGASLLSEPLTARLLLALATVAAGIYLVNRGQR